MPQANSMTSRPRPISPLASERGSLFEDTRDNRRLCGQGDQDVAGFIKTLKSIGFNGPWGVEILSEEHRALPVREALRAAHETALACFPADPAPAAGSPSENDGTAG
ncbi:hypothetical protein NicSoilB8_20090 [Arthrobacter sp. NicSoilB8]|nr:hypothetical protein NicSoilB8_20090 [Arthrobacter sp. NicSoilB8]